VNRDEVLRLGKIVAFGVAVAAFLAALLRTAEDRKSPDEAPARPEAVVRPEASGPSPSPVRSWMSATVEPRPAAAGNVWEREKREERAERIYGWNCMPCHGAEGKGNGPVALRLGLRPRDFTRGAFKLKTSAPGEMPFDEDIARTILSGFPQGAMPAFRDFSTEELWGLVDYVKSLSGRGKDFFAAYPARNPIESSEGAGPGDPLRGGRLFREQVGCPACHGARGRGDGPVAAELVDADGHPVRMTDFAWGRRGFKAGGRAQDVFRILTTGMEGSPMPSFRSLPVRDRSDLAAFVVQQERPEEPGEALFLDRGCGHCHTLGRGKLVGPDLAGLGSRRTRDWVRQWLLDPPDMIRKDEQARKMATEYPTPMPNLNLKAAEADVLADFLLKWTPDERR
jgi:cytochrome c oxidase cbb3-type subunit 2